MKHRTMIAVVMILLLLAAAGCAAGADTASYRRVSAQEAKEIMDTEEDYVILDVRTYEEYAQGHIPGAVLLSHDTVADQAEEKFPDKEQLILVYCRSGNRSRVAAQALAELGYTNVIEFGGITDWPYEVEK